MADGDETTEETPVEEATSEEAAPEENDEVQAAADEPGEAADEAPAPSKEKDAGSQDHEGADLPDWIWLEPHQEGLFGTEDDARDQATISSDEAAIDDKFKEAARNKLAMGMVLACVCFIVGGFAIFCNLKQFWIGLLIIELINVALFLVRLGQTSTAHWQSAPTCPEAQQLQRAQCNPTTQRPRTDAPARRRCYSSWWSLC